MKKEYLLTAEEMQQCDKNTIEKIGLPGLVLMERAAFCVAQYVKNMILERNFTNVWVIAGNGNNAADGVACARILKEFSIASKVFVIPKSEKQQENLRKQIEIAKCFGVDFVEEFHPQKGDLIIDTIFGIGLNRDITGDYEKYIYQCNESGATIISVDIPSGIHATTGQVLGNCIQADVTVTFGFFKKGLFTYPGKNHCGVVIRADMGINESGLFETSPKYFTYYDDKNGKINLARKKDGNKGTFGKILIIAGNESICGAALLCSKASFKSGCGMVSLYSHENNKSTVMDLLPEVMFHNREENETFQELAKQIAWCDVLGMGPGMGTGVYEESLLEYVIENTQKPLILDADAIQILAGNEKLRNRLKELQSNQDTKRILVMTPHIGELSSFLNISIGELKQHKDMFVKRVVEEYGMILVCKDADTLVAAPSTPIYLNTTGCDAMATAGSGDVLLGLCLSFVGQYMKKEELPYETLNSADDLYERCFKGICMAVYVHGKCGEYSAKSLGNSGSLAGDMINELKNVII